MKSEELRAMLAAAPWKARDEHVARQLGGLLPVTAEVPDRVTLVLPWPPSVNHYWRCVRGRFYIGAEGKAYRVTVARLWREARHPGFGTARLGLSIYASPPDRRERDLDNLLKAPLDALAKCGAYQKDSQIDRLSVARRPVRPGNGGIVVELRTLKEE